MGMPQASFSDTAADSLTQTFCQSSEILMLKGSGTGKRSSWENDGPGADNGGQGFEESKTQVLCSRDSLPEY